MITSPRYVNSCFLTVKLPKNSRVEGHMQAIVKSALAPALNRKVIEACRSAPFADGCNDQDARKFFAIMVRFWDENACHAIIQFLAMSVCNRATAEALFDVLSEELNSQDIPWSNVIGYASDTASVMVGRNNSVLSIELSRRTQMSSVLDAHVILLLFVQLQA